MKILQTFWSGPASKQRNVNFFDTKAGWLSAEYHWMSWALSCLQLKKYFGNVELITDEVGKEILINTLELPYTTVLTRLEKILDDCPPDLWALAKIHSYSQQTEPFLHVDGDVFIWDYFEKRILSALVVAQNIEKDLFYYREMLEEIHQHFSFIPSYLPSHYELKHCIFAANAGIIGGQNNEFIKKYCQEAFDFVNKNRTCIDKVTATGLNFIFEQCLLYYYSKQSGQDITYFMPNEVDDPMYKEYVLFSDLPKVKMIHTVGGFKKMPYVCDHLAMRLRMEYPQVYYRIIDACRRMGISMNNKVYLLPFFDTCLSSANASANFQQHPEDKYSHVDGVTEQGGLLPYIEDGKDTIAFRRTAEAISYVLPSFSRQIFLESIRVEIATVRKITEKHIAEISNQQHIGQIYDILNLEYNKYLLALKLTDPAYITALYNEGVKNYTAIYQFFSRPDSDILKAVIKVSDEIKLIETGWNWGYDLAGDISELIRNKFQETSSVNLAALVPKVLHLKIEEYYPDYMDMLIIDMASEIKTVEEILEEMREYFDNTRDEDEADYRKLLLDAIKRLMHMQILVLSENTYVDN
jgi:hypothetical protein